MSKRCPSHLPPRVLRLLLKPRNCIESAATFLELVDVLLDVMSSEVVDVLAGVPVDVLVDVVLEVVEVVVDVVLEVVEVVLDVVPCPVQGRSCPSKNGTDEWALWGNDSILHLLHRHLDM